MTTNVASAGHIDLCTWRNIPEKEGDNCETYHTRLEREPTLVFKERIGDRWRNNRWNHAIGGRSQGQTQQG